MKPAIILGLALLTLSSPPAAASPTLGATDRVALTASVVSYQVKSGDNLYTLAQSYLTRPSDYAAVQRLNHVRNPRRLAPGATLQIPARLLRTEPIAGRLAAFRGAVGIAASTGAVTPARGLLLREGYRLTTGGDAFLTLELPDGSRVTLPSQSRLRIERLRRVLLTGAVERRFVVEEGRSDAVVTPFRNPLDRFLVVTPLAVSAVRGTEFRTNYDPALRRATLEVVEGIVADIPTGGGGETRATAGQGVETTAAGMGPPRPLLTAPQLIRSGLVQDEAELSFAVGAVPQAVRYRAQIARDAGFIDILAEADSAAPSISFPSLANDTYFVRITAIDSAGLEGLPAAYAFERRLNTLALAPPGREGRHYRFRWSSSGEGTVSYRFVLRRAAEGGRPLVDQPGLTQSQFVVTGLPAGAYSWRVLATRFEGGHVQTKSSQAQTFEVGP